jgi:hypothetical protein
MNYYFDDESFDPRNLEHWLLLLTFIGFSCYSFWLAFKMPDQTGKPTHRYNRQTGQIERNED